MKSTALSSPEAMDYQKLVLSFLFFFFFFFFFFGNTAQSLQVNWIEQNCVIQAASGLRIIRFGLSPPHFANSETNSASTLFLFFSILSPHFANSETNSASVLSVGPFLLEHLGVKRH